MDKYYKISLGILATLAFILPILTLPHAAAISTGPTGIIIPLYGYPNSEWDQIATTKTAHPSVPIIAIINPSSGPGTFKDTNFVNGINKLKSAGVTVLGYTHTNWAARDINEVKADIDAYKNWYPVNGIMFDQMSNKVGFESYYSSLNTYTKSKGFTLTVGNPGTDVPKSYIGTMDQITIYEKCCLPSLSFVAGWHANYDKKNFSTVSYRINTLNSTFILAESQYVGYIFETDGDLPDPYTDLPSYWNTFVSILDNGSTSGVTLTVKSVDLSGNPISGLSATISTGTTTVQSGFTPLSYTATSGTTYTVTVSDYQNNVFDHWSDGSTSRTKTVTPTQATTLTAYYKTSTGVPITVKSADMSSNTISGFAVSITSGVTTLQSGFTPLSYTATSGTTYSVAVSDYQNYIFDHWDDGSTSRTRTVTPTQATTLTAYYKSTQMSLTVKSVDLSGNPITGLAVSIKTGTTTVQSGFTPLSYTATSGTTYTVTVSNYQNYVFDHWGDGSTSRTRTVTPTGTTTLIAYYSS